MMRKWLFVEKREGMRMEAEGLRRQLNNALGLTLKELRIVNAYSLWGFTDELLQRSLYTVFADLATDRILDAENILNLPHIAYEYLPAQYDSRAAAAEACVAVAAPDADIKIRTARILLLDPDVTPEETRSIAAYCINPVESRAVDNSQLRSGFLPEAPRTGQGPTCAKSRLAIAEQLTIHNAQLKEGADAREMSDGELERRIIETYRSDHCRHTTFNTPITEISVEEGPYREAIEERLRLYDELRRLRVEKRGKQEPARTLMDLATIGARTLVAEGAAPDVDQGPETNACGIYREVETADGRRERYLVEFKNETHNHPTEIEPYGGAATCIGGAVRDPLSGRAPVFLAARISGAGDVWAPADETLEGKLPQSYISRRAAEGFSSYGNQLGIATPLVREIFHPGYVAKRLETGAVMGAAKAENVRRERPEPGDVVVMAGGATGRDGIGGATGSSKGHTACTLTEGGAEVQKGNPIEEIKLQRIMRRADAVRLIKKANDFGAGGVAVAVGELAEGLDIHLDRMPLKYEGLSAAELALSESQERMAVVVAPGDVKEFIRISEEEDIEAVAVAEVTDTGRLRFYMGERIVADLDRETLERSEGGRGATATIKSPTTPPPRSLAPEKGENEGLGAQLKRVLGDPNVATQRPLGEMFDPTIGSGTVLAPYGGRTGRTESQVAVASIPADGRPSLTAGLISHGFNPYLSEWSPLHGGAAAVAESLAKAVAAGADPTTVRFSFQEYFERLDSAEAWGKPLAALLGALGMQMQTRLPAIGGKDSMSGTFEQMHVPPTLISFGMTTVAVEDVISPEFKTPGSRLYLLRLPPSADGLPDGRVLMERYADLHARIKSGEVTAAYALGPGGAAEAVVKMSLGNEIGAKITLDEDTLFGWDYGNILAESRTALPENLYREIGITTGDPSLEINGERFGPETLDEWLSEPFERLYPGPERREQFTIADGLIAGGNAHRFATCAKSRPAIAKPLPIKERVRVYLPVFPGTNCDRDMAEAFRREGAECVAKVFRNRRRSDIATSLKEMADEIDRCHILAFSGGFTAGDEPEGSAKFMAQVIREPLVAGAICRLIERGGLVLGICNGFQALLRSGLLPYGAIGDNGAHGITLTSNDTGRHVARMVTTRLATTESPWLAGFEPGSLFITASSHGEGRFMASAETAARLAAEGLIAFQYADPTTGEPTMGWPDNPNGSAMAIEGLISPDGQILGKMTHSERHTPGTLRNIPGAREQNIFRNAVAFFRD